LSYREDSDLLTNAVAIILTARIDVRATYQYNAECYQEHN